MSQSATSTRFLNTPRDGDSTTSLGSLFQCLTTLSVKKFFLISSLNLPWCNLRPLPLILLLVTWEKRPICEHRSLQVPSMTVSVEGTHVFICFAKWSSGTTKQGLSQLSCALWSKRWLLSHEPWGRFPALVAWSAGTQPLKKCQAEAGLIYSCCLEQVALLT